MAPKKSPFLLCGLEPKKSPSLLCPAVLPKSGKMDKIHVTNEAWGRSFKHLDLSSTDAESCDTHLKIAFLEDSCPIDTPFRQVQRTASGSRLNEWLDTSNPLDSSNRDTSAGLITINKVLSDHNNQDELQGNDSTIERRSSAVHVAGNVQQHSIIPQFNKIRPNDAANLFKSLLEPDERCEQPDSLWTDDFASLIQGAFFRACIRPPCLQDEQLAAKRFEYEIARTVRCSLVFFCLSFQFFGAELLAACGRSSSQFLNALTTAAFPVTILVVGGHAETLHMWVAFACVCRYVLLHCRGCEQHQQSSGTELCSVLVAAFWLEAVRHLRSTAAETEVRGDREAYERAWSEVLENEEERDGVVRLCRLCAHYQGLPRASQCAPVVLESAANDAAATRTLGGGEERVLRVHSVDQLHQQSMLLQPLLRQRVQWWAARSQGWLRARGKSARFVKAADALDEQVAKEVQWSSSKSVARSQNKLASRYHFDVSRLCDVTRETIWFDSVKDLEGCLMEVSWDRWTEVVGVKNTMSVDSPARCSGGFRFVKLQLRLASPQARELGLHKHVSEVLLVLKRVEASKRDGWHARYLRWRQQRPCLLLRGMRARRCSAASWLLALKTASARQPLHGPSKREEESARAESQENAADEMLRRRTFSRVNSGRGKERQAMLADCLQAMKNYLWGVNSGLIGTVSRKASNIEEATNTAPFAACFRMKKPIASVLCRAPAQAILVAAGTAVLARCLRDLCLLHRGPSSADRRLVTLMLHGRPHTLPPLSSLVVGIAMIAAGVCGYLKRPQLGYRLVMLLVALSVLPHLLALALLLWSCQLWEAAVLLSWGASTLVWLWLVRRSAVLEAFLSCGFIAQVGTCLLQMQGDINSTFGVWEALDPIAAINCAIGLACKAWLVYNDYVCDQEFQKDVNLYHHVWDLMQQADATSGVLDKLHSCAQQINAAASDNVMQRCPPWPPSLDEDVVSTDALWWRECELKHSEDLYRCSPPTGSIDQLYAQAEVAAVVMQHKIRQWAVASQGLFLRRQQNHSPRRGWAKAVELLSGEEEAIRWGALKSQGRAVEKAFRCYGGEVGRLLDLSRHSIVFEEPAQLLKCLELLRADPDCQLLRVKNDLHASHHSPSGYRHLLVNLLIITDETQRLGVSTHVSELQLVPLGFALAKTTDGHRRYVRIRNARGE